MPNPADPWETESLVPFNDGDVTFVDAYFEEGQYGVQLTVVNRVDVPRDPIEYPAATFNTWWSTGKDWVVVDGGARIVKPDATPDRPAKIHASSKLGTLMDRVVKQLGVNMRDRGLPTEAKVWKELRFAVKRESVKYTGLPAREGQPPGTTTDVESSILLPVRMLGALGSEAPAANPSPAPTVTPPPATPPPTTAATPTPSPVTTTAGAIPPEEQHLVSIIVGKSSITEAKTAAMRDEQIATNDSLTSRILENQLIESYFENGVLSMADGKIAQTG